MRLLTVIVSEKLCPLLYVDDKLQYTGSVMKIYLFHGQDEGYGGFSESFSEKSVRLAFIRKVYSILCLQVKKNYIFTEFRLLLGHFEMVGENCDSDLQYRDGAVLTTLLVD
jgi:hypothetical protein